MLVITEVFVRVFTLLVNFAIVAHQVVLDLPITDQSLLWFNSDGIRHLCLVAESLSFVDGKKLQTAVGECCQMAKYKWTVTKQIYSQDGTVCIKRDTQDKDVKFTTVFTECGLFTIDSAGGELKLDGGPNCIGYESDGTHKYRPCRTGNNWQIRHSSCPAVNDFHINMKFHFSTGFAGSTKYCWFPENKDFDVGKKVKADKVDCCSVAVITQKTDNSLWMTSPASSTSYCIAVEGMPYKHLHAFDGKGLKLSTECKGAAYVLDSRYKLLRLVGTDRCLFWSSSQEFEIRSCSSGYGYQHNSEQCKVEAATSSSSSLLSTTESTTSYIQVTTFTSTMTSSFTPATTSLTSTVIPSTSSSSASSSTTSFSSPSVSLTPSTYHSLISNPTAKPSYAAKQSSTANPSLTVTSAPSAHPSPTATLSSTTTSSYTPISPSIITKSLSTSLADPSPSTARRDSVASFVSPSQSIDETTVLVPVGSTSVVPELPFIPFYDGEPINGGWGNWTNWSSCSVNCGTGKKERYRYCDNPEPRNGGTYCVGEEKESKRCSLPSCSGISYSKIAENCLHHCKSLGLICSFSINTGNSKRDFESTNISCSSDESGKIWTKSYEPAYHVADNKCTGYVSVPRIVLCNVTAPSGIQRLCNCITQGDKGYGEWAPWSECSVSCNRGQKIRSRQCTIIDPPKDICQGASIETIDCNAHKCPVDGGFSNWSPWSPCTKSCDGGTRKRNRTCSEPFPQYRGALCYGIYVEKESCGVGFCPVHGQWTDWTEWQHCDKPCNTGRRKRERWCTNPVPMYGGQMCQGYNNESVPCHTNVCPNATITLGNVAFDKIWSQEYKSNRTKAREFGETINSNVKRLFKADFPDTYDRLWLESLREGSVIASFKLYFYALDSFQALFIMDAINDDHYLGKLPIVTSQTANLTSPTVPSSPPANVTAVSIDASSIRVTWDENPLSSLNGMITGYLVFHREMAAMTYTTAATTGFNLTIQGLQAATEYAIRVLAYNSKGNGIASELIKLYTQEKAPSLPPRKLSVITRDSTSVYVEWMHPPTNSWNGVIKGYILKIREENIVNATQITVNGNMVSYSLSQLIPDTLYIVDVCAFTSAGTGPCLRSFNKTLVSAPSVAPGNVKCQNKTSTDKIDVQFSSIPMNKIHGYLKGYRIEYRLHRIGIGNKLNNPIQFVVVNPYKKSLTLKQLMPNSVYKIQIMAVNEHGVGVKSQIIYGATCACPETIYTNYASAVPYIYRDHHGNMQGIFKIFLQNMTSSVCGLCNAKRSTIDYINDGKNGWADKGNIAKVTEGIDDYVHMSFVIAGRKAMRSLQGFPYVSIIDHPGMILFTAKPTVSEQVSQMLESVFKLWPIFVVNTVFIVIAGIIFWSLTSGDISSDALFCSGSLRGMYWAFITMFTHGYGDIVPYTGISRIFAIIWILIGLITAAILIGGISTALTSTIAMTETKLYGIKLATLHGSKEELIGIYRNAQVNTKKNYMKIDDVYKALKNREVEAALVDSFVAANRPDLFSSSDIVARKIIMYPFTYGLVLSGAMKNVGTNLRNYVSDNRYVITKMVQETTPKFTVNYADPMPISLFDPKSPFLRTNLLIMFAVFVALFFIGCVYSLLKWRCKKKNSVKQAKIYEGLRECEIACKGFFDALDEFYERIDKISEDNVARLAKLAELKRKYPYQREAVQFRKQTEINLIWVKWRTTATTSVLDTDEFVRSVNYSPAWNKRMKKNSCS